MSTFRKVFTLWLLIFLLFFVLANLAGVIRPMGIKPFRFTGFPFIFMAWGFGIEKFFDWKLLLLDCIIGFTGSIMFAGMLAWIRCRSIVGKKT